MLASWSGGDRYVPSAQRLSPAGLAPPPRPTAPGGAQ